MQSALDPIDEWMLFDVQVDADNLVLRLDKTSFAHYDEECEALEIHFRGCSDFGELSETLQANRGNYISIWPADSENTFDVTLETGGSFTLSCQSTSSVGARYSEAELRVRYIAFAEYYSRLAREQSETQRRLWQLNNSLTQEIREQLGRWELKLQFFEQENHPKKDQAETAIEIYRRLERLLQQSSE